MVDLIKKLPNTLRTPFWEDFFSVVRMEIDSLREDKTNPMSYLYDLDTLEENENINQLIEVAKTFGYTPDITLVEDLTNAEIANYLRREVESIPFRFKNRTTYKIYQYIYDLAEKTGQTFIYYWNGVELLRAYETLISAYEKTKIETIADVSGSLSGKYFLLSDSENDYYVWINVDSGSIDPEFVERTGIEINISTNDSANTIAGILQSTLDAMSDFTVTVLNNEVTVTVDTIAKVKDAGDIDTGFYIVVLEDGTTIDGKLDLHDPLLPFVFKAEENFELFLFEVIKLDSSPLHYLDDPSGLWFLDQAIARLMTKHMAHEYSLVDIIIKDSTDYLMTGKYQDYSLNAVLGNKKLTEFPHAGVNLSMLMDNTLKYDSAQTSDTGYSVVDLKMLCVATDKFSFINTTEQVNYMKIGTGAIITLPSKFGGGAYPSALQTPVYKKFISEEERTDVSGWTFINKEFPSNSINNFLLGTGDDTTFNFLDTLDYKPNPYSVVVTYISNSVEYIVTDNEGNGILYGLISEGTVDYNTGNIELITQKELDFSEDVSTPITAYQLANLPVKKEATTITYTQGENTFQVTDVDQFDDTGSFAHGTGITSGFIDYLTGQVTVVFDGATTDISIAYVQINTTAPDSGTDIIVSYKTKDNVDITEVGVFNQSDELIAYGTFPPISLGNTLYHMCFQFFVKHTAF